MTLEEFMVKRLVDNGMFPSHAAEVLTAVKAEADTNDTKDVHWSDEVGEVHGVVEGYPPQLVAALAALVTRRAAQWVDENCSKA